MQSIIRLIPNSKYGIVSIFVILVFTNILTVFCSPSCGLYGAPPCRFLPAPPGHTPACARPGKTYCEHADNYPTYLIKHLIHKWGYEAKNLVVDESWDDFSALTWHNTPVFYDPAFIFPPKHHYNGNQFDGYDYETPPVAGNQNGDGKFVGETTFLVTKQQTTPTPTFLFYSSAGQHLKKNGFNGNGRNKVTPNTPTLWLKRIVRDLHRKSNITDSGISDDSGSDEISTAVPPSRDISLNMNFLEIMGIEKDNNMNKASRVKRQSPGRSTLCQTTSQFIAPQAALNNKGNWMFVVNEPSAGRQLVKAELCASNICSNLCQLPNGYNSRCEQKFVQKRLIALQASGQNLYTDSFWFPSCCVCTISTN